MPLTGALQIYFDANTCPVTSTDVTSRLYWGEEGNSVSGQYVSFSKSTNARWNCHFVLVDKSGTGANRPVVGQSFRLLMDSVLQFSGFIDEIQEGLFEGSSTLLYACSCSSWASLLDRRVVKKVYQVNSAASVVIADIIAVLAESITTSNVVLAGKVTTPLALEPISAAQAFDTLRDMTDAEWWIDENKDLHFIEVGNGAIAGFSITETALKSTEFVAGSMKVTRTAKDKRNVQIVSSSALGQAPTKTETSNPIVIHFYKLITDYFDWIASAAEIKLSQPVQLDPSNSLAPSLLIAGVPQTMYDLATTALGNAGYYYKIGSDRIAYGQPYSVPSIGQVTVTYQVFAGSGGIGATVASGGTGGTNLPGANDVQQNWVEKDDTTDIATMRALTGDSGRWEQVTSVPGITDPTVAKSLAAGLLSRSTAIPDIIEFQTWRSGYAIGSRVQVTLSIHNLNALYTVQEIQAQGVPNVSGPISGGTLLYSIKLSNAQNIGDYIKWFEGLVRSIGASVTGGTGAGSTSTPSPPVIQIIREVPSGLVNGVNKTYTLTYKPNPPWALILFINGVIQHANAIEPSASTDYTLSSKTITMAQAPRTGDMIEAVYFIQDSGVAPTQVHGTAYSTAHETDGGYVENYWKMYIPATPGGGTPSADVSLAFAINTPYSPSWSIVDTTRPDAGWIGPVADGSGPWSGTYKYELTFNLNGTTGNIVLNVAGNGGSGSLRVYLNGVLKATISPPTYSALHNLVFTTGFSAGKNVITILEDSDNTSPVGGLLVQVVTLPS